MRIYVASRSGNSILALEPENVIAVCATGPSPERDAQQYAKDETRATDRPTWVYAIDTFPVIGYKVEKEVIAFDPANKAAANLNSR